MLILKIFLFHDFICSTPLVAGAMKPPTPSLSSIFDSITDRVDILLRSGTVSIMTVELLPLSLNLQAKCQYFIYINMDLSHDRLKWSLTSISRFCCFISKEIKLKRMKEMKDEKGFCRLTDIALVIAESISRLKTAYQFVCRKPSENIWLLPAAPNSACDLDLQTFGKLISAW